MDSVYPESFVIFFPSLFCFFFFFFFFFFYLFYLYLFYFFTLPIAQSHELQCWLDRCENIRDSTFYYALYDSGYVLMIASSP